MSDPTPFPTVNVLLADLLAQMRPILGGDLIGLYLDGSLALGDFDPATSDVDFIAAIARPLSAAQSDALAAMHRQMRDSGRPFATELEGSYIPRPALRRHDPADATFANLERGSDEVLKYKTHHSDWVIHRTTVREHGIALFGPPPATLIDPVSPDDVRRATTLNEHLFNRCRMETTAIASIRFGSVKCRIGVPHEIFASQSVIGVNADTDTGADMKICTLNHDR